MAALFVAATWAGAQPSVRVTGMVRDSSGAAIPGASVELRAAHFSTSLKTDSDGHFAFGSVPDSAGSVRASAAGFTVAGTNERHPLVDVFSYLGTMAVKLLFDAGTAVRNTRVVVACDNPFASYLESGLSAAGAVVRLTASIADVDPGFDPDFVVVSLTPTGSSVITPDDARLVAERWPTAVVAQFWGDIDRGPLDDAGVRYWPLDPPPAGHMAILPSQPGPEPVVRLQAGGFKVASVLLKPPADRTAFDLEFLDEL